MGEKLEKSSGFRIKAFIRYPKPTKREVIAKWNEYRAMTSPWAGIFDKDKK